MCMFFTFVEKNLSLEYIEIDGEEDSIFVCLKMFHVKHLSKNVSRETLVLNNYICSGHFMPRRERESLMTQRAIFTRLARANLRFSSLTLI